MIIMQPSSSSNLSTQTHSISSSWMSRSTSQALSNMADSLSDNPANFTVSTISSTTGTSANATVTVIEPSSSLSSSSYGNTTSNPIDEPIDLEAQKPMNTSNILFNPIHHHNQCNSNHNVATSNSSDHFSKRFSSSYRSIDGESKALLLPVDNDCSASYCSCSSISNDNRRNDNTNRKRTKDVWKYGSSKYPPQLHGIFEFCQTRAGYLIQSSLICGGFLLITQLLIGLRLVHILVTSIFFMCYNGPTYTRKFACAFSIFIIFAISFDYMRILPNYQVRPVSIDGIYEAEKMIFGFCYNDNRITLNEFWLLHKNSFLTLISGFFYLMWIPLPLGFAAYLFFNKSRRKHYFQFALNFLFNNLLGFTIYYAFPAAPPWYYQAYGLQLTTLVPNQIKTGLLKDFDTLLGIPIFQGIYGETNNIFASMPSLHVSYPCLVLIYGLKLRLHPMANIVFAIFTVGISFAAIYTSHHYLLDVLAGLTTACLSFIIFQCIFMRSRFFADRLRK